ncbi:MAG TPA: hypothetical protein VFE72_07500 [Lysobacter sp.]|nr:hypothetical protein [Lysobacter sp.]
MKIEATTAALVGQSATTASAAVAVTGQWWFAIIAAAVGTLFAVHAERAHQPGELRKVVMRIAMLTAFSWLFGAYVGGLPHVPFMPAVPNPAADIPEAARTAIVGLFSPYLHAYLVAFLKRRAGMPEPSAT